jgi:hypothetical protein
VNNRWSNWGLYCKQSNNFLFLFSIWLIEGGEGWSFSITTVQFVYYLMPDIICAVHNVHTMLDYNFPEKNCYWVMLVVLFPNNHIERNWIGLFLGSQRNFPYGLGQFTIFKSSDQHEKFWHIFDKARLISGWCFRFHFSFERRHSRIAN